MLTSTIYSENKQKKCSDEHLKINKEICMKCSQCQSDDLKVIESRDVVDDQSIRRRRMCNSCGYRFTTYERTEKPQIVVIKKDNSRELFNRQKLLAGIYRACEKTPITSVQIENLADKIEQSLYDQNDLEISSKIIGELVMEELIMINEVAYVRFASVYRRFKDISSFEKELSHYKNRRLVKN